MPKQTVPSSNKGRSILIVGRKCSISVEDEFWDCLHAIAGERGLRMSELTREISVGQEANLSSALRVYVVEYYRKLMPHTQNVQGPPQ